MPNSSPVACRPACAKSRSPKRRRFGPVNRWSTADSLQQRPIQLCRHRHQTVSSTTPFTNEQTHRGLVFASTSRTGNMNTLGIHALVWAGDFTSASARKVIASSKRAGYDLVELSLHAPVMDIALTRDLLQEFDMQIACSRGLSLATDISSEHP